MTGKQRIPFLSLVFGFGPMLPFVLAAIGVWALPAPWPEIARTLALVWGALILSFIAGVRRGYGFGAGGASRMAEIAAMVPFVVLAGLGLLLPPAWGAAVLAAGFALAAALDTRAARRGDAPPFFAHLRPMQLPLAALSLAAIAAAPIR